MSITVLLARKSSMVFPLRFLFAGILLTYTAWSYWMFRGKLRGDLGYH
jgi:cytochrome bd-type quinol oxidase subunit 2